MAESNKDHRKREERRGKLLDRTRINEIVVQLAALPVVDDRSPDALVGYDERGLPR
jgi:hypothetical protein